MVWYSHLIPKKHESAHKGLIQYLRPFQQNFGRPHHSPLHENWYTLMAIDKSVPKNDNLSYSERGHFCTSKTLTPKNERVCISILHARKEQHQKDNNLHQ